MFEVPELGCCRETGNCKIVQTSKKHNMVRISSEHTYLLCFIGSLKVRPKVVLLTN